MRRKQTELSQGDPELEKGTKTAAEEVAATRAAIKKRKDDAFLGGFGQTADTTDLERELAVREGALDSARKAQASDRSSKAAQSKAISDEIRNEKSRQTEVKEPDPSGRPSPEHKAGTITDNKTGVTKPLSGQRDGPGIIRDSSGAVVLNSLTQPGQGSATRSNGSDATVDLSPATIAAIAAAFKAASGAGGGTGEGAAAKDAADKLKKGADGVADAMGEIAKTGDKMAKDSAKVAAKQKNDRERSGGG